MDGPSTGTHELVINFMAQEKNPIMQLTMMVIMMMIMRTIMQLLTTDILHKHYKIVVLYIH